MEGTTGATSIMDSEIPFGHTILLSLIVCFGLASNLLLLLLQFMRPSLRTTSNVYVANKVLTDVLLLLLAPFHLIAMTDSRGWNLGQIACQIIGTLDVLCIFVSLHSLFALSHQIYAIFLKPKWELDNTKAFYHNVANWIYCAMLVLPIPTTSYTFQWDGLIVCGYKWPPMQNYYAMYFISLFAVGFLGPYSFFIWWFHDVRRVPATVYNDIMGNRQLKDMCKLLVTQVSVELTRLLPFWAYHFTVMVILGHNFTHSFHVPGGTGAFNMAVSWTCYLVASSNIFVLALTSDNWRVAVRDAFHCRFRSHLATAPGVAPGPVSVISVQPADEDNSYDNAAMGPGDGDPDMIEMETL